MNNGFNINTTLFSRDHNKANDISLMAITLKLIDLNKTPLTANCPYFKKLKANLCLIAEECSDKECQAFLAELKSHVMQKQINQELYIQLITEFVQLTTSNNLTLGEILLPTLGLTPSKS